ncbi:hypothetical protein FNF31_06650 [Cafeteria roenbergensis]|uniref:Raptor N-terminal CASPase-like domain-containing protein n=1 Tax=Cafeteria roenbergensis TaxID=33653 RepID=A0A5A8CGW0_CAFRO|nr:hypothetical protein FNF31_06650 [Cafeteria roenbergensis]KAA0172193.1 hypothetical protein FNF28_00196 [Cafeteria roenbergensis]
MIRMFQGVFGRSGHASGRHSGTKGEAAHPAERDGDAEGWARERVVPVPTDALWGADATGRRDIMFSLATMPEYFSQARYGLVQGAARGLGSMDAASSDRARRRAEALLGPPRTVEPPVWRLKAKGAVKAVGLALCLNIGTDPPDCERVDPCARLECWIDPLDNPEPRKALKQIAEALHAQWAEWVTTPLRSASVDPTADDIFSATRGLRNAAGSDRVVFHMNMHGVPAPSPRGEIWAFNSEYTKYVPLPVSDVIGWLQPPALVVLECSRAGILLPHFAHARGAAGLGRAGTGAVDTAPNLSPASGAASPGGRSPRAGGGLASPSSAASEAALDWMVLAACAADETLPTHPAIPADLFTATLLTPVRTALHCRILDNPRGAPPALLQVIPLLRGSRRDKASLIGELHVVLTTVADTVAWSSLPRRLFLALFRADHVVASIFRNFLLAQRVMRTYSCTPMSLPALPPLADHPLWAAWDDALDAVLAKLQLSAIDEWTAGAAEALAGAATAGEHTAGEGTQQRGSLGLRPRVNASWPGAVEAWTARLATPGSARPADASGQGARGGGVALLPVLLQAVLSPEHRARGVAILARFLDLGSWASRAAISVGAFPYLYRIASEETAGVSPSLLFVWAKIAAADGRCHVELSNPRKPLLKAFAEAAGTVRPAQGPSDSRPFARWLAAFLLSRIAEGAPTSACGVAAVGAEAHLRTAIAAPDARLRLWAALALANTARGVRDSVSEHGIPKAALDAWAAKHASNEREVDARLGSLRQAVAAAGDLDLPDAPPEAANGGGGDGGDGSSPLAGAQHSPGTAARGLAGVSPHPSLAPSGSPAQASPLLAVRGSPEVRAAVLTALAEATAAGLQAGPLVSVVAANISAAASLLDELDAATLNPTLGDRAAGAVDARGLTVGSGDGATGSSPISGVEAGGGPESLPRDPPVALRGHAPDLTERSVSAQSGAGAPPVAGARAVGLGVSTLLRTSSGSERAAAVLERRRAALQELVAQLTTRAKEAQRLRAKYGPGRSRLLLASLQVSAAATSGSAALAAPVVAVPPHAAVSAPAGQSAASRSAAFSPGSAEAFAAAAAKRAAATAAAVGVLGCPQLPAPWDNGASAAARDAEAAVLAWTASLRLNPTASARVSSAAAHAAHAAAHAAASLVAAGHMDASAGAHPSPWSGPGSASPHLTGADSGLYSESPRLGSSVPGLASSWASARGVGVGQPTPPPLSLGSAHSAAAGASSQLGPASLLAALATVQAARAAAAANVGSPQFRAAPPGPLDGANALLGSPPLAGAAGASRLDSLGQGETLPLWGPDAAQLDPARRLWAALTLSRDTRASLWSKAFGDGCSVSRVSLIMAVAGRAVAAIDAAPEPVISVFAPQSSHALSGWAPGREAAAAGQPAGRDQEQTPARPKRLRGKPPNLQLSTVGDAGPGPLSGTPTAETPSWVLEQPWLRPVGDDRDPNFVPAAGLVTPIASSGQGAVGFLTSARSPPSVASAASFLRASKADGRKRQRSGVAGPAAREDVGCVASH